MADDADELVLNPGSFTGPERRLVQQHLKVPFADLMKYTREAVYRLLPAEPGDPNPDDLRVLVAADGALVFPDEVLQVMAWIQARRTNPDAQLEDFDGLTMSDLNSARLRGMRQGKALTGGSSPTSSTGSPSADSSPA